MEEEPLSRKLIKGALIGWFIAFVAVKYLLGFNSIELELFLSMAPGAIAGVIIVYVINKPNKQPTQQIIKDSKEDRLIKLKSLLDQNVLTQEEFDEQKKRILSE